MVLFHHRFVFWVISKEEYQGHKVRSKDLYVISPIDKRAEPNVKLLIDWLGEIKIHCF